MQGTTSVYEDGGAPIYGFAADAQHVWWTLQAGPGLRRIVRTDRANNQTVTLVSTPSSLLQDVHIALSEDYVLVASSNSALSNGPKPGFIARYTGERGANQRQYVSVREWKYPITPPIVT